MNWSSAGTVLPSIIWNFSFCCLDPITLSMTDRITVSLVRSDSKVIWRHIASRLSITTLHEMISCTKNFRGISLTRINEEKKCLLMNDVENPIILKWCHWIFRNISVSRDCLLSCIRVMWPGSETDTRSGDGLADTARIPMMLTGVKWVIQAKIIFIVTTSLSLITAWVQHEHTFYVNQK